MSEFDYQWKNLPSKHIELNEKRVEELLKNTGLSREYFKDKICLDAGCGSGRYTYAMLQLGAKVMSIDLSEEAVKKCREINTDSYVVSILDIENSPIIGGIEFDFIYSFGVLHHMPDPRAGFLSLVNKLKKGGKIYLMLYEKEGQKRYEEGRKIFRGLSQEERVEFIRNKYSDLTAQHGWFDALNPEFNYGFSVEEVIGWFEGFESVQSTKASTNVNLIGTK